MYQWNETQNHLSTNIFCEQQSLIIRTQPVQVDSISIFFENQEQNKFKSCQFQFQEEEIQDYKVFQKRRLSKKKDPVCKSVHHNSQKQAVITFKHLVKLPFDGSESTIHFIAQRMWFQFLNARTQNKELLSIVFGCQASQEKKMANRIRKYKFTWLEQFDQQQLKQAQRLLRILTTQQITLQYLENHIKSRRIKEKQGFRLYMLQLLQQLKRGPILRRLEKGKSQGITNIIKTDRLIYLAN